MNFFEKLLPIKLEEIEQLKKNPPLLKKRGERASFKNALRGKKEIVHESPHLIGEIKLHSPSKGHLQDPSIIDQILPLYNQYASAISVLTDQYFFKGNFERLNCIAEKSPLPLICKDFILDPFQIELAQKAGASAILLIAKLLSPEKLLELYQIARSKNLDVLVEIHDGEDLKNALEIDAEIIGINHRNLETLKIEMQTSHKLRARIPTQKIVVAESGINSAEDIRALPSVNAVLIGTSLMRSSNPELLIQELCKA